jgi:hypothetical protein
MTIVWNEPVSGFTISSLSLTRSGGPNLLTGSQTLTTSDNTTFTLNNLSSLDVLGGTYVLKFSASGSGVVDSLSHAATTDASTMIIVLPTAPEVNAIYVSGSAWQQSFLNYLAGNGLGDSQLGYRLIGGPNQLASLPWVNINVISVVFSRDVNINTASLALVGSSDLAAPPALSTATYSYNSTTHVATWVYRNSLSVDKYLLSIPSSAVTSVASGQTLDGEFVNGSGALLPSGDAAAGGNFNFRFNILPGDVDQNGVVTGTDGGNVRLHFMQFTTSPGYNPLYDTYGKGAITGIDLLTVQGALLTTLPTTDPGAPGGGGPTAPMASAAAQPATATPAATTSGSSFTASSTVSGSATSTSSTSTVSCLSSPTGSPVVASSSVKATSSVLAALGLPSAPAATPAAHDAFFASLGGGSTAGGSTAAGKPSLAPLASVTSLNSLGLSSAQHSGWMQAHDALFARLDNTGGAMMSTFLRSRKSRVSV